MEDDEIPIEDRIEEQRTKIFMKGKGTKVCKESLIALWGKLAKIAEIEEKKRLKAMRAAEKKKNKSMQVTKLTGK